MFPNLSTHLINLPKTSSVAEAWRKARKAYLLNVCSHLLYCILHFWVPYLAVLAFTNEFLAKFHSKCHPIKEELEIAARLALYSGLTVGATMLLSVFQVMMFFVYSKYGHPWSKVLNKRVDPFPWENWLKCKVAEPKSLA